MQDMIDEINAYVEHGQPPSGFIRLVLQNDLMGAMGKADEMNKYRIWDICNYIYNKIPRTLWGSKKIVDDHLAKKQKEREANNGIPKKL